MESSINQLLERHDACESIPHAGPYAELLVPISNERPHPRFVEKWVSPFYRSRLRDADKFVADYSSIRSELSSELISELLIYSDWRPRIVGAYFSAIQGLTGFTEHIGRLLLRSDLAYAGSGYALALTSFNSSLARDFLDKYLSHYLLRTDLWFDQGSVMAATVYLDRINDTHVIDKHIAGWQAFIEDKPNLDLESFVDKLEIQMNHLTRIANI